MNDAFSLVAKTFLVALLAVSTIAIAADKKGVEATKSDPAKGEALYTNGDAARGIPACVSCHGVAGNSTIVQNPKLAAQHDAYIYKQLSNFKDDERSSPIMTLFAKALSDGEMKNLAAYLNLQTRNPGAAKNKDTVEFGKKIFRAGIAEINVPACAGCHGPNGAGIPAQYPRIGGQHQEYTAAQLTNFRAGTRKNSAQMMAIAKRLTDEEIQAVADYVAGLR